VITKIKKLRLDGKIAIVTGAAQGIGREEALLLAKRGAKDEIKKMGGEAIGNKGDISEVAGAEKLANDALVKWGCLDIVINDAGVVGGTLSAPEVTAKIESN
jgi:NAD(P)-dependent dehydrogenase (short-subunit alcohol dehydrogenase family)